MFLLSQNDENQSENGSKNSKIRLRARPPAEPQKKMLQTKKLRSKSWKTRVFFTFRLPILDGRVHEQVSSVLFFTVFFEGERHDLSKTGGFGRKMPPPPGKPVTFYECHPEDHAPAPSVRADLSIILFSFEHCFDGTKYPTERQTWQLAPPNRFLPLTSRAFLSRNSWDVMGHVLCYVKLDMRSSFISTAHMGPNMGHCYIWYEIQLN